MALEDRAGPRLMGRGDMSRLLRAIFVVAAMLALQPYVSLATHISEQQAIQAFQALQARVDALEQGAGQIGGVGGCLPPWFER